MHQFHEVHDINYLQSLQTKNRNSLILVYVHKSGLASDQFNTYWSMSQSLRATRWGPGRVIFTHNLIDRDESVQSMGMVGVVPALLFIVDGSIKMKLEDLSQETVWKYIERYVRN